jgi:hypothetical protein
LAKGDHVGVAESLAVDLAAGLAPIGVKINKKWLIFLASLGQQVVVTTLKKGICLLSLAAGGDQSPKDKQTGNAFHGFWFKN